MLPRGRRWLYAREKTLRALEEFWWTILALWQRTLQFAKYGRQSDPPIHPLRSAVKSYVPKPYDGSIVIFRATQQPFGIYRDRSLGWDGLAAKGVEIEDIRCLHAAMVSEPRVGCLADKLRRFLV
jgi:thioesterase domain-containing protein